jgi:serine/threonine protein phosphatase PrpC
MKLVNFGKNNFTSLQSVPDAHAIVFAINQLSYLPPLRSFVHTADFSHNCLRTFALNPTIVSIDLSHNALRDVAIENSSGCPSLEVLKLSHNPDCHFALDFSQFPRLTHVDLCATQITHPFPLPQRLIEIVLATPDFQALGTGPEAKVYATDVGYSEAVGNRDSMEDALVLASAVGSRIYAVVDGHGGYLAAHLISRHFAQALEWANLDISLACEGLHQQILWKHRVLDGAVFAAAVITDREVCVGHIGDSRVLRVMRNGIVFQMTADHKASERREMELIRNNGSFVANGRVEGRLAVSRSLGDFIIKGVVRKPDITRFTLDEKDWRLVIACDGVFDVLDNDVIARIVIQEPDVHRAAAIVKYVALASMTSDNVSVIVVDVADKQ